MDDKSSKAVPQFLGSLTTTWSCIHLYSFSNYNGQILKVFVTDP